MCRYNETADETLIRRLRAGESAYAEHDNPESILIDRENVSALENEMEKSLSSLENRVLHLYLEGNSYIEIAEILGKTPKSIDNALRRIRKKIKKYF